MRWPTTRRTRSAAPQLEVLVLLERSTKQLAEPVFERKALDRGDTAATLTSARELADVVATMTWVEFLASIEPVTEQFLPKYRELVELATDDLRT